MSPKIVDKVTNEKLQCDLGKYRQNALELGATDAKVITTDMIIIDERARAKCLNPKCPHYATNANCPPYAMDVADTRKLIGKYQFGIFTIIKTPIKIMGGHSEADIKARRKARMKNHKMVAALESIAFYDGYHLALGLADGPCKTLFCPTNECSALVPGHGCRHALKTRASLEGLGMNAYGMAASVGWDIYPVGGNTPEGTPHGVMLGLVMVY